MAQLVLIKSLNQKSNHNHNYLLFNCLNVMILMAALLEMNHLESQTSADPYPLSKHQTQNPSVISTKYICISVCN